MCHTEGVVSDCPNRERLGYGPEGAYQTLWGLGLPCFGSAAYYIKNARDWSDVQHRDGAFNNVAPQISIMYGCVLNGTAILNTAWEHYRMYGDRRLLQAVCPVAGKWLDFLETHVKENLLTPYARHGYFLGDWVSPGPVFEYGESEEALFFNNCAYAMTLETFLQVAGELCLPEEKLRAYSDRLSSLRAAIHEKYYSPSTGVYLNGDQVRTAFALFAGIAPHKQKVRDDLLSLLRREGYINIGSFGRYPFYKTVLEDPRYTGALDTILSRKAYPGYGYFMENACSTWPETWEINHPNCTMIHTSYTGISAFFVKTLAGIEWESPGCDTLRIAPDFPDRIDRVRAALDTPYGKVESAWERSGEEVLCRVTVPYGAVARVALPGEREQFVPSGKHSFRTQFKPYNHK
jgi:alpha-L-rhamnosidase